MDSRDYECIECDCWFTVYNALWSEESLQCPVCQAKVKHLKPHWEGEVQLIPSEAGKVLIEELLK